MAVGKSLRRSDTFFDVVDEHGPSLEVRFDQWTYRHALPQAIGTSDIVLKTWIGPLVSDDGFLLVRASRRRVAKWDAETRREVHRVLLDKWLENQRRTAHIEWFWGRTPR
jgi:hypothetical protein